MNANKIFDMRGITDNESHKFYGLIKTALTFAILFLLLLTVVTMTGFGGVTKVHAATVTVSTWDQLQSALADDGTYIQLYDDVVTPTGKSLVQSKLTVPSGVTVTLDLNGHSIDRNLKDGFASEHVITVNGNLTIKDSSEGQDGKITGGYAKNSSGGGIFIYEGKCTLESGWIYDNSAAQGGGVYLYKGEFIMKGGQIRDNDCDLAGVITTGASCGAGVYMNSGTFTMSGGGIYGNLARNYGAGVYVAGGTFNMTGGTIGYEKGNYLGKEGGGVYLINKGSTFNMSGGLIGSNDHENVLVGEDTIFTMTGGEIGYRSTGVRVRGTFVMEGGSICNVMGETGVVIEETGTAWMTGGTIKNNGRGGVEVLGDTKGSSTANAAVFQLSGGTISGNQKSGDGAGVYVKGNAAFIMSSGTIKDNIITTSSDTYNGAGVCIDDCTANAADKNGYFVMWGGTIEGNTNMKGNGGGVYAGNGTNFVMQQGTIKGNVINDASYSGAGVYAHSGATINVMGKIEICDNHLINPSGDENNLHVKESGVNISSKLENGSRIGVTLANSNGEGQVTKGYKTANFTNLPSEYFYSDKGYHVTLNNNEVYLKSCTSAMESHVAKAATCKEQGNIAYKYCPDCQGYFNINGKNISEASIYIPALGHNWDVPTYVWTDDHKHVTAKHICKRDHTHEEEETVETSVKISTTETERCVQLNATYYTALFTNPAFATQYYATDETTVTHTPGAAITTVITAPTCETAGSHNEEIKCTKCGDVISKHTYSDPALGHDYEISYTWQNNESVTANVICKNDHNHIKNETANTIERVIRNASCDEAGQTVYTAFFTDPIFAVQTQSYDLPEATGHRWGKEITYNWEADYSKAAAYRMCENNPDHVDVEVVNTTREIVKASTCTEKGVVRYTASFNNAAFSTQSKETDEEAKGHSWREWTVIKAPTVTETGIEERTCSACNLKETRDIARLTSQEDIDKQIIEQKGENDLKDSNFSLLMAKGVPYSKKGIKLTWKKVPGAVEYIVYGNKCGKKNKYERITEVTSTSLIRKNLKTGTYYKHLIVAIDANGAVLAASKTIHCVTNGSKYGNNTKVVISKKKITIKAGKSKKVTAKLKTKKPVRIHRPIAWESDNPKVATVNNKGRIKAVAKGTCYVYAYAQNGIYAKIKVKVK